MLIGEIIKEYRTKYKLTMDDFAKRASLSKGFISMLEKNENPLTKKPIVPSLDKLKDIAEAMNMSLNELIKLMDDNLEVHLVKTTPPPADLKRILEEKMVMFDGEVISEEDKILIKKMLTKMYYKANDLNKRK